MDQPCIRVSLDLKMDIIYWDVTFTTTNNNNNSLLKSCGWFTIRTKKNCREWSLCSLQRFIMMMMNNGTNYLTSIANYDLKHLDDYSYLSIRWCRSCYRNDIEKPIFFCCWMNWMNLNGFIKTNQDSNQNRIEYFLKKNLIQ